MEAPQVQQWIQEGLEQLATGHLQEAKGKFAQSALADASSSEALVLLIEVFLKSGQPGQAEALLAKTKVEFPNTESTWLMEGIYFLCFGEAEKAILSFQRALQINSHSPEAYCQLGIAYAVLQDFNQAAYFLTQALILKPDLDRAHLELGRLLLLKGYVQSGLLEVFYSISLNPRLAIAYETALDFFDSMEEYDFAHTLGEIALKNVLPNDRPLFFKRLAFLALRQQKTQAGLAYLQQLLSEQPGLDSQMTLGYFGFLSGDLELDRQSLEQAALLDPSAFEPYYNLGLVYEALHNIKKAQECYEKAISLAQLRDARPYNNLGVLLLNEQKWQQAEDAFQKAVAIDPKNPSGFYHLGICRLAQKDLAQAKDMALRAIERSEQGSELYFSAYDILQIQE